MRVLQILPCSSTRYSEKCFRLDGEHIPRFADVGMTRWRSDRRGLFREDGSNADIREAGSFDLIHLYDAERIDPTLRRGLSRPHVSDAAGRRSWLPWRTIPDPKVLVSPIPDATFPTTSRVVPEPVTASILASVHAERAGGSRSVIGCVKRDAAKQMVSSIAIRLERFRDDLDWRLIDHLPSAEELSDVDVWVDPVASSDDWDGGVAEAVAAGVPVVASRFPVNEVRLEGGEAGFLVPPGDANEFAHVTLTALFKPEISSPKIQKGLASRGRFSPEVRARALIELYAFVLEAE